MAVLALARPAVSAAQVREHVVHGRVVDPTGGGVADASVEAVGSLWIARTRADGAFELSVPGGDSVRVRVRRIGYVSAAVTVAAGDPEPLVVRLRPAPLELRGVSVVGERTPPLAQTITTATVRQVPPLGEPDVFRAAVLLPGVSQPNDLKGRIHLGGGASDETGVRLDGHPLQEPFHLLGVLGAFNVAALERADVLIHHLPTSVDGRLSGLIDLESRRPAVQAVHEATLGLLSSGFTYGRSSLPGGIDVLASARATYLDRFIEATGIGSSGGEGVPLLGYQDALLRAGRSWGGNLWRSEALGFLTHDVRRSSGLGGEASPPLDWGERIVGVSVARAGARWSARARASFDRATARQRRFAAASDGSAGVPSEELDLRRDWASAAAEVTRTAARWRAGAGVEFTARDDAQSWDLPATAGTLLSPNAPPHFVGSERQRLAATFVEASREVGRRWEATLGGRATPASGRANLAPRALVRFSPGSALRLEAALERRHQFDAHLEEPREGSVTQPVFLLRVPRTADVAALSAAWRAEGRRAFGDWRLSVFAKRYRNKAVQHAPGDTAGAASGPDAATFPDFERVPGRSTGIAVSWTQTFGARTLIQGSYTLQRVTEVVDGVSAPTSWDAPHAATLFASAPLRWGWSASAVFQARSGAATTPVAARIFAPTRELSDDFLNSRYLIGRRNSARLPAYRRLDVGVRRAWRARRAEWAASVQVVNLLARRNALEYDWGAYFCRQAGECRSAGPTRTGLPLLPSFNVEVRW